MHFSHTGIIKMTIMRRYTVHDIQFESFAVACLKGLDVSSEIYCITTISYC